MTFMLKPAQQALTYDKGYFYPGPAVKDVPLSMAPAKSQDVIKEYGRPEYAKLLADRPHVVPLKPRRWSTRSRSGTARSARRRRNKRVSGSCLKTRGGARGCERRRVIGNKRHEARF